MGKLHDLVKFRNYLIDSSDKLSLDSFLQSKIEFLTKTKSLFPEQLDYINKKVDDFLEIDIQSKKAIAEIDDKVTLLNKEIDEMARLMFDNEEYRNTFDEKNVQGLNFQKELILSAELESWVESEIMHHCDWHYPALQINPRCKKWIDLMVAGDPLYLTHFNINIVKDIIKTYPSLYQTRLRLYEIINRDLSKLPQGQFGFVLCWDNFNYISLDKFEKYLREVWSLLRPGGHFIFSYSNCDLDGTALRAEYRACSYASLRWLTTLSNEIGYEIIETHDDETGDAFNTHVSWAELRKPGILKTVKAHQSIAEILTK